ncbi:MAG: hypothetical protein JSV03_04270 [Planctomycetota bacterium]|nr:MAG: hypothetical protein JSV03_04270 [Planctomycetota bacterium]
MEVKTVQSPEWVKKIPNRMAEILVEKHLCKNGPVWGLARRDPTGKLYGDLEYEEIGSAGYCHIVDQYRLWDKVPPLTDQAKKKALQFWQSWQDPKSGLFKDPRDPNRTVGEKYVVNLIRFFGGEPLYPQKESRTMLARDGSGNIDTKNFLERAQNDPDWAQGGWAAGSHTGYMAREIFSAINNGHIELIPDLEKGLESVLSHQDPASGLWGPSSARLDRRLGGTLKVITRLYFGMGVNVPYAERLADSLIVHERNGDWYRAGQNFCVPQNVIYMVAFCLEACDYRRDDLLGILESKVTEYEEWVLPDGTLLLHRGDPNSACVEGVHLTSLSILSGYLAWKDSPFTTPIDMNSIRKRWQSYQYRAVVQKNGSVKVVDKGKQ